MPKATVAKGEAEYLPDISLETFEKMQKRESPGKARTMIQAAVLRKRGKTLTTIRECIGFAEGTVHGWLARLVLEGLERRYDTKSLGRPPLLNQEQLNVIDEHIDKPPQEGGFDRGNRTGKIVARLILNKFNVSYTHSGALKLAHRMDSRSESPVPYHTTVPRQKNKR